jgi:hypothetical protein
MRQNPILYVAILSAALAGCTFRFDGLTPGGEIDLGPGVGDGAAAPPSDFSTAMSDLAVPPLDADTVIALSDLSMQGSQCSSANLLFCDGFEDPALPGWGQISVNGNVTVDQKHAYRGQSALRAHQNGGAGTATALVVASLAYPSPDVYVRAFGFVEAAAPSTNTFMRIQQSAGKQASLDLQMAPSQFLTRISGSGDIESSQVTIPIGRWFCIEWQVHVAQNGYFQLNIDGQMVWTSSIQDMTNKPAYNWLVAGLDGPGASAAYDLWLDELAVDGAPIGCAK